jgi:RNA polymerase sigma-70 factor (ECF subfamily)
MECDDRSHDDEADILERARELDQAALTWVYQTYHVSIYRYLYHHLGDVQTAEDLASDVFRRFLESMRKGRGPTRQLRAWLYRVAHNLIVDELRRRKHRNHRSLDETLVETLGDARQCPSDLAYGAAAGAHVREMLLDLAEEQRQAVVLRFLEGMSNAEIAQVMGKSVGAVKALQHRALSILRRRLGVESSAPIAARNEHAKALST